MQWKQMFLASALVSGLAVTGCSSMHKEAKIDQSRMASIPESQKPEVTQAQNAIDQAKQDQTAAKQAVTEAESRVKLAESELDVAKAEQKQAENALKAQQKSGQGQAGATPLTHNVDAAKKKVDAEQAKVDYLKKLSDIAKTHEKLANSNLDLAKAKLDQANFIALERTRPEEVKAMKVTAPQFQAKVAEKQADVARVNATLSQQRIEARDQYNKWSQLDQQLSQTGSVQQRRASVPPPPRG